MVNLAYIGIVNISRPGRGRGEDYREFGIVVAQTGPLGDRIEQMYFFRPLQEIGVEFEAVEWGVLKSLRYLFRSAPVTS